MDTLTAILVWATIAGLIVGVAGEHIALRRRVAEPLRGHHALPTKTKRS